MTARTNSTARELTEIFTEAVRKAQERNRRLGIPNVYSRGGLPYWEKLNKQAKSDK